MNPISLNNGVFIVNSYRPLEEGSFTVLTTVTDNADHSSTTISSPAVVTDAPLSGSGMPISASSGQPFTATVANFSDANPAGSAGPGGDDSATIDWGDSTPPSAGTISASNGSFQISASHTYATPGNYSLTIRVSDEGGATTTITTSANVTDSGGGGGGGGGSSNLSWGNNTNPVLSGRSPTASPASPIPATRTAPRAIASPCRSRPATLTATRSPSPPSTSRTA